MSAQEWKDIYSLRAIHFDFAANNKTQDKGIGMSAIWAAIARYHEEDMDKAMEFAEGLKSNATKVTQSQVLARWIFANDTGGGASRRQEIVERALYCMDAHYRGQEITRCMRLDARDAFRRAR
jgi:GTP cyclohydrolase FolE2